jgi:methyl-accepting chemotaxis protein
MDSSGIKDLTNKLFSQYQRSTGPSTPPVIYLLALVLGLTWKQAGMVLLVLGPTILFPLSSVVPKIGIKRALEHAFHPSVDDQPEERLKRLLKIPRIIEVWSLACGAFGTMVFAGLASAYYGNSLWIAPWAALLVSLLSALLGIHMRVNSEQVLNPYVKAEFHRLKEFSLKGSGLFWTRHKTYLPYTFAIYVLCTAAVLLTVIGRGVYDIFTEFVGGTDKLTTAVEFKQAFLVMQENLLDRITLPLILLGVYLVTVAAASAWRLAIYQAKGTQSVQEAIEALASGNPKLPEWVSSDEIGDLSLATAKVFVHLKNFSLSLGESARSLGDSAQSLGLSAAKQNEMLTRQASALQETQVTAQEIKQTSELASQKAEGVLQQAEKADEISRTAEDSVERSVTSLQEIRDHVQQMAQHIKQLGDKTRQIGRITATVKDLADQSNMLALNASIEAVRSGEHGKGFAVVAREIRLLADQSIRATNDVRSILLDVSNAIKTTVSITEQGSARVEEGLKQVREFGDSIRLLSGIVRESGSSARQISAAVSQQNIGISEIFQAVNDMSKMMDETMERLKASDKTMGLVQGVAAKVSGFVTSYGWQQVGTGDGRGTPADANAPAQST